MSAFELRVPSFEHARFGRLCDRDDTNRMIANDFFFGVERDLVVRSARAFRCAALPANTLVFRRWQPSSVVFLVIAGRIELERHGAAREPLRIASVEAGAFCGEDAFLPGPSLHRVDARCTLPTTLSFARAEDLSGLLEAGPAVTLNLARSLHARLTNLVDAIKKNAPLDGEGGVVDGLRSVTAASEYPI